MFSVDNFYEYLSHKYAWPRKNNLLWHFLDHGSRNLYRLQWRSIFGNHRSSTIQPDYSVLSYFYGGIFMFDQEPIDFSQLFFDYNWLIANNKPCNVDYHKNYSFPELLVQRLARVYTPIICHSERNSREVRYLQGNGYLDVHFWYHGLISRDWFRHWKHYTPVINTTNNRLGCYIRDTSGSREYRKNLLELIKQENIYCPMLIGETHSSESSAILEWDDTNMFDIHIVAETLFNTQKTHLTEKALKPVAMEQPFILFSGPNSLQYMRDYGFQTFACCWDESYDEITNNQERYRAVTDLIKNLNSLPADQYKRVFDRAKLIAKNNREHFYSQKFEDVLLNELHTNMQSALEQQEENFTRDPGGSFFRVANELKNYTNGTFPSKILEDLPHVLAHIKQKNPNVAKQILKQYPDLF